MNKPRVHSFEPIQDRNAEILILGSMPGRASLAVAQYYAHPQNAFWRIVGTLHGFEAGAPYATRVRALKTARIALWDVLQSCTRDGSLDARIDKDTEVANDFRSFFRTHDRITRVFFNGAKAEASFARHVLRDLDAGRTSYARLPSTSPANAAMSLERKLAAWRAILGSRHDDSAQKGGVLR